MRKKWPRKYSISTGTIVLPGADEDLNTLKYFAKSLKASPQARAQEEGNRTEVLAKASRAARLHFVIPGKGHLDKALAPHETAGPVCGNS